MGFLDDLGLGDIIASVREMTDEISGLKDDIVASVVEPVSGLQDTVQDISSSISGDISGAVSNAISDTSDATQ